jgi:hypothetical protein
LDEWKEDQTGEKTVELKVPLSAARRAQMKVA